MWRTAWQLFAVRVSRRAEVGGGTWAFQAASAAVAVAAVAVRWKLWSPNDSVWYDRIQELWEEYRLARISSHQFASARSFWTLLGSCRLFASAFLDRVLASGNDLQFQGRFG